VKVTPSSDLLYVKEESSLTVQLNSVDTFLQMTHPLFSLARGRGKHGEWLDRADDMPAEA